MNVKHVSAGTTLALVLGTGYFPATADAVGGAVRGATGAIAHGGLGNRAHGSMDAAARGSAAAELSGRRVPRGQIGRDDVRETAGTTRESAGEAREAASSNADAVRQQGTTRAEASVRQADEAGGRIATRAQESAASTERPNSSGTPVGALAGLGGDVAADASADRSGVGAASRQNSFAESHGHFSDGVEVSAEASTAFQAEASAETPPRSAR
jgi:hypothetical protein